MRIFNFIRIGLALLLLLAGICLTLVIREPAVQQQSGERVSGQFSGDYHARIDLAEDNFRITEEVSFAKRRLDSFTYQRFFKTLSLGKQLNSFQLRSVRHDAEHIVPNWRLVYFQRLRGRGWKLGDTTGANYSFQRVEKRSYKREAWHRFQVLPIGLLFEDIRSTDMLQNDTLFIESRRLVDFNYKLSAGSDLSLYAPNGLINKTYPATKPADLLDSGNRQVYRFTAVELNLLTDNENPVMVLRVQMLNPLLNNAVGEAISDWSPGQVLGWLIVAITALFADKVKKNLMEPVADRIWPDRKDKTEKPQPPKRPFAKKKKAVKH